METRDPQGEALTYEAPEEGHRSETTKTNTATHPRKVGTCKGRRSGKGREERAVTSLRRGSVFVVISLSTASSSDTAKNASNESAIRSHNGEGHLFWPLSRGAATIQCVSQRQAPLQRISCLWRLSQPKVISSLRVNLHMQRQGVNKAGRDRDRFDAVGSEGQVWDKPNRRCHIPVIHQAARVRANTARDSTNRFNLRELFLESVYSGSTTTDKEIMEERIADKD